MQDEPRVVALALTTLSMSNEGVFLVGFSSGNLENIPGPKLRLTEIAHLYVKQTEDHQVRNVFIEPVLGFEEVMVNTTAYTAYGYLSGELLDKYLAWHAARKEGFPAVEEAELPTD
jgi:hypothetical protein